MATPFALVDPEACSGAELHPVVLFSVLDHYLRRNEGQTRVIGALLGRVVGGVVHVTNCYPVPHVEQGDEVAVGKEFSASMFALHCKVNPDEQIVGWYATSSDGGKLIDEKSCLVHGFFASVADDPIHLVVDTSLTDNTLGVKAFTMLPLSVNGVDESLAAEFTQIEVELACTEPEKIAVDLMLKKQPELGGTQTLESEMTNLEVSMERLLEMLDTVCSYVDDVNEGARKPEYRIGRQIAEVISTVPRIKPEVFAQSFNSQLQDMLMVVYLSNMTRTQLQLAETLGQAFGKGGQKLPDASSYA